MSVRVRFAPSPTGHLHIGSSRTTLFNWLFARNKGGKFILRIEDTDVGRSKEGFVEGIMKDLRWLGLEWDEGPDVGGEFGPYRQSDRLPIYKEFADKLLQEKKAYHCYCTPEELEQRRQKALEAGEAPRYDNRCRDLSPEKIAKYKKEQRCPALRFKVPEKKIELNDLIRGCVKFDTSLLGDLVIMKSDGMPTFNFAVTVDDYLMRITHVIRGEDHLSNTPKHILLFEALGAELPQFAHMSMTLSSEGGRLSKRTWATSITEYRLQGYLPEALLNYMAFLGWTPPSGREIISLEEMIGEFDIKDMTKSAASFDIDKLNWISGHYIRTADLERVANLCLSYLKEKKLLVGEVGEKKFEWLERLVDAVRDHMICLSQITDLAGIFLKEELPTKKGPLQKLLKEESSKKVLLALAKQLTEVEDLEQESLKRMLKDLGRETGFKGKDLYSPIRAATTAALEGPELIKILPLLGKEVCLKRIRKALK